MTKEGRERKGKTEPCGSHSPACFAFVLCAWLPPRLWWQLPPSPDWYLQHNLGQIEKKFLPEPLVCSGDGVYTKALCPVSIQCCRT